MPLYDSFGKKATKRLETADQPKVSRAKNLMKAPAIEDLMEALRSAQETIRQPIMLMWRKPIQGGYMLTVIRNSEEDYQPTWMLHEDKKDSMDVVWSYTTSDTELINNLITEQVAEFEPNRPKAVIPESLRPQAPKKPEPEVKPDPGQPQFFENYEILSTIGQGGMGIIYKARDRNDGQFVALKVLRADLMVDKSNISRFKHEAAAVRGLKHANLIGLKEFGLSRFGQPFLAMDYLEGVELKHVLEQSDHLDMPTFVNVFTQICDALAYTHEQGLVHRDLKPGNIMLVKNASGQPTVKIIDFGIAKSLREQPTVSITSYGQFLGSPAYMSPEQCGGAVLDSRSDIYSLGCVMYEAVTGVLPFKHDNILKTVMAQVQEMAPPFASARSDLSIPSRLEEIIFTALQKNPDDRYQSVRDLSDDLWEFAASGLTGPAAPTPPSPPPRPLGQTQQLNPQSNRQPTSSEPIQQIPQTPQPQLDQLAQQGRQGQQPQPAQQPLHVQQPQPAMQASAPTPLPFFRTSSAGMPVYREQPSQGPRVPHQSPAPPSAPPPPPPAPLQSSAIPPAPGTPGASGPAPPAQVLSGQIPALSPQSAAQILSNQGPALSPKGAPTGPPSGPPPNLRITGPIEPNVMPDVAYTILRRSEVLNDNLLSVLRECVQSLENGEITFDQAVAIIRHTCGKHD